MARVTARRQPSETGPARVCQSPRGYILKAGGKDVGRVYPRVVGFHRYDGWYYAITLGEQHVNTRDDPPFETAEAARDAAITRIKELING